ncbi:hypothetical protein ASC77_21285 [Nocardioides sp. Root1257]|uniref:STAS domain-containing protein n=1 Tax=unclassified Nocardioides TaxID=2615069 RepID=UPI0006FDA496|nr:MULTISPECIES: STAS domain-containing protein [unclassified Nocardioides]KQW43932.1 hypothetical protein ASC77_21285 [Nocardioides sp. Root1257]KRC42373.1 hypothetical protein ASE24_21080 [Nocardioides sp. Root224]
MAEIAFERGLRRLRVAGPCTARDSTALREAVDVHGRSAARLTIDLTGVPSISPEVVSVLADSVGAVEAEGCRVTIVRKCSSDVDHALRELHR